VSMGNPHKKRMLSIGLIAILLGALLIMPFQVASEEEAGEFDFSAADAVPAETMPESALVIEKGGLSLRIDPATGLFELQNTQTGKIWYSTPPDADDDMQTKGMQRMKMRSQMMVEYIFKSDESKSEFPQTANSQIDCIDENGITVNRIENGFRVLYRFPTLGITVPVAYTLRSEYLSAAIEISGIVEDGETMLTAVHLLPVFGAGNWESEGYLFVPDGSGALVYFNNQVMMKNEYNSMVYGEELAVPAQTKSINTQTVRLPIFGTVTGGDALMGIITEGDGTSSISVINGNERCGYNAVSSKMHFRMLATQYSNTTKRTAGKVSRTSYVKEKYEVRYYPLSGETASYAGMAGAYRNYLIQEKGLVKQIAKPAFHVDLMGAAQVEASFLGIPYQKLESLTTGGIDSLSVRYRGWSHDGLVNNKIPKKASPLGLLGGVKGFSKLNEYINSLDYMLYPDVDLLTFRTGGNGVSKNSDSARTVFRQPAYLYSYMLSVFAQTPNTDFSRLLTPGKLPDVAAGYLSSAKKNGLTSLSLSTLGNLHYSNLNPEKQDYRSTFIDSCETALKPYREAGISLSFDSGNAYVLPFANLIVNAPVSSSRYDIFDRDVPFYQMVLHGYVPYTTAPIAQSSNPDTVWLAAVETGSEPLYTGMSSDSVLLRDTKYNDLYSSTWSLWAENAAERYKAYAPLMQKIHDATIVAHEELSENVYLTTYENGICVVVNYGDELVKIKGQTVPARGYAEWRGE